MKVDTIIGISGLWCNDDSAPTWSRLSPEFSRQFPGASFHIEQEPRCQLWSIRRLRKFASRITEKYDDGRRMILVGHSMGGIVACAVANKCVRSRVCAVVTIFSPNAALQGLYPWLLGASQAPEAPIICFGGKWDRLVPIGTRHRKAKFYRKIPSNHLGHLATYEISSLIARNVRSQLVH